MRVLYHPNIGAVFINRFPAGARALRARRGPNWRAWVIGRWRLMVVRATAHWVHS